MKGVNNIYNFSNYVDLVINRCEINRKKKNSEFSDYSESESEVSISHALKYFFFHLIPLKPPLL